MYILISECIVYTDPESHNAQRYRQRDDMMMPIADHYVAVYWLTRENRIALIVSAQVIIE